uniref:Uncharacterized protein n=1 Tax=Leptobrachium leishanense TaxID=445787 RepID=A0A8C5PDX1_9ANUR
MAADGTTASCIRVDLSTLPKAAPEAMHLLPCEVQREGAARVSEYFNPAMREGDGGKEVSFRGRALRGQDVDVPTGFIGLVLKETHKPCTDDEDRCLTVRSTFSSFTQWNLETPPCADDVLVMSMIWPKIAEAIHSPVQ